MYGSLLSGVCVVCNLVCVVSWSLGVCVVCCSLSVFGVCWSLGLCCLLVIRWQVHVLLVGH